MSEPTGDAPGWPGIAPRWTSSAKSGVGAAVSGASRVWFTLSHGILDEVYYPRVDQACTRDLGLIVTDGAAFFSEEKRHARSQTTCLAAGVPAYRLRNTCGQGRYRIEKEVIADPLRDVVLQRTRFVPLEGPPATYHLYALLAPHLGNRGAGNIAWIGDYKGTPMLFAERDGNALALACSIPWRRRSAGFAGFSDGWQDLTRHAQMTWTYARAEHGNVSLTGEIDLLGAPDGVFVLALGFGRTADEAGHRALASLLDGFDAALHEYVREWQAWQRSLLPLSPAAPAAPPDAPPLPDALAPPAPSGAPGGSDARDLYRASAAVLRTHEAKHFPGGLIASLSIPWGFAKGDDDLGGYHLVWPRDLVETAGGLLAAGARDYVRRVLTYLQVTQEADGHWPQNMWLDGTPYWTGVQMDETAFPILLVDMARREGALAADDVARLWPMVRRAAAFLVRNGPVTQQDRWEEDPGYSPFTLAVEIAALLAAADLAETSGEAGTHADPRWGLDSPPPHPSTPVGVAALAALAAYLRDTADAWNDAVERWTYVAGTELAAQVGVEGYYVRIAPPETGAAASPLHGFVPIKNRPPGESTAPAARIVSPDALALVRFGLRAADDPRIVDTVKVVDALLRVETPFGPAWRRYPGDGYGEQADGAPFDGTGIGRAWPLLTGERAHYELAAGRPEAAERLRRALEAFANDGGLLPEQVWDAPDVPERELFFGRPSGSAMPLVWAHAEYVKLCHSLRDGVVFDTPPQPVQRYVVERRDSPYAPWRFNHKCAGIPAGKVLRLEALAPAVVHWSLDGWRTAGDTPTHDTGLGVHLADLPTDALPAGSTVLFTFYWPEAARWEGADFAVGVE